MKSFLNVPCAYGVACTNPHSVAGWIWLLGLLLVPCVHALEYELQGVARDEPRALDIHFQVCVRDCQWRIRCWHDTAEGLYFDTALLTSNELIRVMEFSTQRWATAVIESNRIPTACEEPAAALLWLLLASSCSWSSTGGGLITPVYDPLASCLLDRDRRQPADWEMSESSPHLLKRIVYWNDGRRRIWNSKTQQAIELPSSGAPPFTNAIGSVTEFSQVGALTLPQAFEFVQYSKGGSGSNLRVSRYLTGHVEFAKPACSHAELVPRPECRTVVQDRRLLEEKDAAVVTYAVNAGDWPDPSRLRSIRRRQQRGLAGSVGWELAIFCGLALAPLAVAYWRRRS